jgi:predicted anti-sigma-YlaC factor YlaD
MEGKMNCDECKDLITISVYGKLAPETLTQLQAHLRECSGCATMYERSEKLSDLNNQKDNIPLPDKEKSWQIISAKALKKKRGWLERFALQKPVFQYSFVLLLLIVGFAAGYYFRSDGLKGSQLAQLQQEVSQIREISAASLLREYTICTV